MPVTATFLGYPFDSELFMQMWSEVPDPRLTAMIASGAMVSDAAIAAEIQSKGNFYTIPFYNILDGEEFNYDGKTTFEPRKTSGTYQNGIVYGRGIPFGAEDFISDLHNADPMGHIANTIAKYWRNKEQARLIGIINGIFSTTDTSDNATKFKNTHVLETGGPIEITDINRLMTMSLGDNKRIYRMAIMHSNVAERLENLNTLNFQMNNNAQGGERSSEIFYWNGLTVIIDDGVPVNGNNYTTYLFGAGSIRTAEGSLKVPAEVSRKEWENGGEDYLTTRIRRTIHPNGFRYKIPTTNWTNSPTNEQLFAGDRWEIVFDPKAIPIAKLITTETMI